MPDSEQLGKSLCVHSHFNSKQIDDTKKYCPAKVRSQKTAKGIIG